jgi:hypothetical protein
VGSGWTTAQREAAKKMGYEVVLREDDLRFWNTKQTIGMAYGSIAKGLGLERAFPHGNPYHRYAFPAEWWKRVSDGADLAVFNYSYWCWLPCEMPKALVLLDLWSDYMWGGHLTETRDISSCAHTFAISIHEVDTLKSRGVTAVSWCPPAINPVECVLSPSCALIGSDNLFNREGLRWLENASEDLANLDIRVYGGLSASISHPGLHAVGRYGNNDQPYRDCGITLFTTVQGMGVQIKTIEALAAGRAIIARRDAVRGLPVDAKGWIQVDSPQEMINWAHKLVANRQLRDEWGGRARAYYQQYLDGEKIRAQMRRVYQGLGAI